MRGASIKDPTKLRYPLLGSPKLDGIRAGQYYASGKGLLSRKLKRIPNRQVQRLFGGSALRAYDGELIAGDPTQPGCWNRTDSVVMSDEHEDWRTVRFYVFDHVGAADDPYTRRRARLKPRPGVIIVPQVLISSPEELLRFHKGIVAKGYEGSMYRIPDGRYKYGRSTLREQILLKHKDFEDCEARIVGFKEERENRNPQTRSRLGYAKRSSHKANKVGKGQVGAFIVKAINGTFKGRTFPVGMGISDELGRRAFRYPKEYLRRVVTIRYRVEKGADKPWNCRLKGLRRD